jgi:hypothetical protein
MEIYLCKRMKVKGNPLTCLKLNDNPAHLGLLKNGVLTARYTDSCESFAPVMRRKTISRFGAIPIVLAGYPLLPQGDTDE